MKKNSYGYVEASHYWWKNLSSTFHQVGYNTSSKDKCVYIKRENGKVAICGATVDDCLFVCTQDDMWIKEQIELLQNKYHEVSIEIGDNLGLVGMQINMNRDKKRVVLTQPKHVKRIINTFKSVKRSTKSSISEVDG
jgi:recombinational DNA repair protein RecR